MTFPITENRFRWLVAVTICLGAFLAYGNSLTGEFVWDDVSSVLLHKHVQDPSQIAQLFREDQHAFGRGHGNFYRPLLACSFMLDFALSKGPATAEQAQEKIPKVSPLLFHLTNIAWHIAAALLLLALLTRIGAPRFVRAVAPIVFVLHPLHTEAVTYISGRGDPMSAALLFAGLWCALLEGPWRRRALGIAGSGLCFVAALLTKESAAIFPVLLLVLSLTAPRRSASAEAQDVSAKQVPWSLFVYRLMPLILSVVILAVYVCLRMTRLHFGADDAILVKSLGQRAVEACQAFALYLGLVVAPTGLHMERTLDGVPAWVGGLGAFLLLLCIGSIALGLLRGHGRAAAGMAWFVGAWLPISGFFPLNAPMAEHWMYVPLAGLLWAAAEFLSPVTANPVGLRIATVAAYALCVWFTALTVARNPDWHSNESLFVATLQKNPKSSRVHHNLAVTYQDLLHNIPGARRHFEHVIDLAKERKDADAHGGGQETFSDEEIESHISLGEIFTQLQDYRQAAGHFGEVVQLKKDDHTTPFIGTAAFGMGQCFLAVGQVDQARRQFDTAVAARPDLKESVDRLLRMVSRTLPDAS